MKLFWIVLFISTTFIFIEECLEAIYKKTNKYKASLGGCERFHKVPKNLEIVNIGSGPALNAISYNYTKKNGFNFATAPQNYKYGFRLLKRFHKNINFGAIILIVIMAPMSFGKNNDYERKDYDDKYYGILPKEDIDHYSWKRAFIVNHPLALKIYEKANNNLKNKTQKSSLQSELSTEPMIIKTWEEEFELKNLIDASQACMHKEAFQEKIKILQDGLNYCYGQNWRPIFVIPPIPEETRKYISSDFMDVFVYRNIKVLKKRNPKLEILDYFYFDFLEDCYKNDIFLNNKGQEQFSKQLFHDIEEL